jgi:hypothetical protein
MENKTTKPTISERINARFAEPDNGVFKDGKWRWWFALVFGLSLGSAIVTALVFSGSVGVLGIGMGVLVLWTLVGTLVYSDSRDTRLSRGVSILDSVALCFVVAHFCFVMYVYGHLTTLRSAEAKYGQEMEAYNAKALDVSKDNVEIARSIEKVSENAVKAERLRNDAAYQLRKASESGRRVPSLRQGAPVAAGLPFASNSTVQLKEPDKPKESSIEFLNKWDSWIRWANFGELILAAVTLIYIRNRSAKFNAQGVPERVLPVATGREYQSAPAPALRASGAKKATPVATDEDPRMLALRELREHLRQIAFYIPNRFFKADLIQGGVSIRLCRKLLGADVTVKTTRQSNKLLDAVDRPDFRARLIDELKHQGFPIEKGGE